MPRTAEHQPWMIVPLRGKRAKLAEEADAILEAAAKADRDLTAEEKTAFEARRPNW